MRPLDSIEPRKVLNELPGDESSVHLIREPGNYFLTADVVGERNKHGIVVQLDPSLGGGDVTIDLNGFSLRGATNSDDALWCWGDNTRVALHGGSGGRVAVYGWRNGLVVAEPPGGASGELEIRNVDISLCVQSGVVCPEGVSLVMSDSSIDHCGEDGIRTDGCPVSRPVRCLLSRVSVSHCGGNGISHVCSPGSSCVIVHEDVHVAHCGGHGVHVSVPDDESHVSLRQDRCEMSSNGGSGLRITCPSSSSSVDYHGSSVVCSRNGESGVCIEAGEETQLVARLDKATCVRNNDDAVEILGMGEEKMVSKGILVITSGVFSHNGRSGVSALCPIYADRCVISDNALYGISVGGTDPNMSMGSMDRCVIERNGSHGVTTLRAAASQCEPCVKGKFQGRSCEINDNGGDGIHWAAGCLVLADSYVGRNEGNGIFAAGTLNVESTTIRRNGEFGVLQTGGRTVANNMVCELNGRNSDLDGDNYGGAAFIDVESVSLTRCVFNDNDGDGVVCRSSSSTPVRWMAPECIASGNTGNGFDLENCTGELSHCVAVGNGGWGISLGESCVRMRCSGNSLSSNGGGLSVAGSSCLITSNTSTNDPAGAFVIGPGNAAAAVSDAGGLDRCEPNANFVF